LSKRMAQSASRRDALRALATGVGGLVLSAFGLGRRGEADPSGNCAAFCLACGISPGGGNAFGKCVSACSNCILAGNTVCACPDPDARSGVTCCDAAAGSCCGGPLAGTCCDPDATCCEGTCCDPGVTCCGGTCCFSDQPCCGGRCCDFPGVCQGGAC